MEDLSLHILDIVENAISAKAKRIDILVMEEPKEDRLVIEIKDDGIGMDEAVSRKATDPFFTTRTSRRVGLGLSLIAQAAQETGGTVRIESELGKGTKVTATFQYHHIDRKPLGNMIETMTTLLLGNAGLDISYTHQKEGKSYVLNGRSLKERFKDRSLTDPEVIQWLRKDLKEGLAQIGVQG
ncbi:MAG: ATP-binding protein [Syntrophaceae bacterium]|nr:ATP-binding protein [Syntrophaceae bacterium]